MVAAEPMAVDFMVVNITGKLPLGVRLQRPADSLPAVFILSLEKWRCVRNSSSLDPNRRAAYCSLGQRWLYGSTGLT
jgi:hypothetical protein